MRSKWFIVFIVAMLFVAVVGCSSTFISQTKIRQAITESFSKFGIPGKFMPWKAFDPDKMTSMDFTTRSNAETNFRSVLESGKVDKVKVVKIGDSDTLKTEGFLHVKAFLRGSYDNGRYPFSGEVEYKLVKDSYGSWTAYPR